MKHILIYIRVQITETNYMDDDLLTGNLRDRNDVDTVPNDAWIKYTSGAFV
jgi:hypothetical protein